MKAMKNIRLASTAIAVSLASCVLFAEEAAVKGQSPSSAAVAEKKYASLAEVRGKIGDIIADADARAKSKEGVTDATPLMMTTVMSTLSPDDQKSFVADVNAAIAKLPGSVEDRTAKYLNINRAALKGAASGNMADVLAVTFASVPPESLVVLSERYAVDLFNKDADSSQKMTDAAFEKTAKEVLGRVEQATTGSDDSAVRNTLAILMFVRASNGSPKDLPETLIETLPDANTRELARKEWVPAAMAEGENKSYDGLLAYADATKVPELNIVLDLAGPQALDAMTIDLFSGMKNASGIQTTPVLDQAFGKFDENMVLVNIDTVSMRAGNVAGEVPRTTDPTKPWNPDYKRDDPDLPHPQPTPPEPEPYPYSNM